VAELDDLVRCVLADVGLRPVLPVDVDLVARRFGVEVRRERLDGASGVLQMNGDRPTIVVETKCARSRARFTLAHELGHYVLARYRQRVAAVWAAQPSLRDPERFCDRFAESLLLPYDWVSTELSSGPQTLERLLWVATVADVSVSAASVRVARVARWQWTLLRLARMPRRWRLVSVTGLLRPGWQQRLEITPGLQRRLDEAPCGAPPQASQWLPLLLEGRPCYAPAQLSAGSTSAIAWVDLLNRRAPSRRCSARPQRDVQKLSA